MNPPIAMPNLRRLFARKPEPREALRPLWHRVVEISRERDWYAHCGVADTVAGRFDMITAVLALVLLRLESDADCGAQSALLTELFVEDMDGQLRESGIGDLVVGKHIGKLMASLGGRLGAYRVAIAERSDRVLENAVLRNVTLAGEAGPEALAKRLRALANQLGRLAPADLLAARIER
ncbi:MAG TPA: ubiquinol-cytochrome C chaperone family protein [Croceibacterium sp.]|jgi:cytochrome b pre-mRNA-processing protein 3|nr:ubiquinol-cytochrome C chaperone family protein [Croceibacterium sp.]